MSDTMDTKWPYIRQAKIQIVLKILKKKKKKKKVNGYTSGTTGSLASGVFPSSA